MNDQDFISSCIKDNLGYFQPGIGVDSSTGFPLDHIFFDRSRNKILKKGEYVNPTSIGLYLDILMLISEKVITDNRISPDEALKKISRIIGILEKCEKYRGLFYWYNISNGKITKLDDNLISTVDNSNMTFSLAALSGAFYGSRDPVRSEIGRRVDLLLDAQKQGWIRLYRKEKGMMLAVECTKNKVAPQMMDQSLLLMTLDNNTPDVSEYFIDRLFTESRLAPVWAILVSSDEPEDRKVPITVFSSLTKFKTTYKTGDGRKLNIFMTWDGALFQELLPEIFINEQELSSLMKLNHVNTVIAQVDYATKNNLPALLSSSSTPDNNYAPFGMPDISESYMQFYNPPPPHNAGTPHASALSNLIDHQVSIKLLRNLSQNYPQIKTEFGWYDCITSSGASSLMVLSLDQGMLILSLAGKANSGYVKKYLERKGKYELLKKIYSALQEKE